MILLGIVFNLVCIFSSPEPWQEPHPQQQQLPDWIDNLDRLHSKLQQHQQQTSTPQAGQANLPPLKTPAAFQV